MKISERRFKVLALCGDCGERLNSTKDMTSQEVWGQWTQLVLSSALVTGGCPKGCRATFSDCNINTNLVVIDSETESQVKFETVKLTAGHFYSESYNELCKCGSPKEDEIYEGEKYPPVHGPCGKFLKPYVAHESGKR